MIVLDSGEDGTQPWDGMRSQTGRAGVHEEHTWLVLKADCLPRGSASFIRKPVRNG
jgi:hypothetical protein